MQKQAVIFELDSVYYGLDIMEVQEIIRMMDITPVAESDMTMEGIINLRGNVIPVINLCRKLGLTSKDYDSNSRIIVAECNGKKVGLIVDAVSEVGTYDDSEITPAQHVVEDNRHLHGIVKKDDLLWLIINPSTLM